MHSDPETETGPAAQVAGVATSGIGLRLAGALVVLALVGSVAEARAQDGTDEEARGLFLAGQAAFEAARYEDALRYWRSAHARSARPELLYNVAIAADRLRRDEEALAAFEAYLAGTGPDALQRRDVEARVVVLREAIAARATPVPAVEPSLGVRPEEASASPTDLLVTEAREDDARMIGGWSLVGGGAAIAVAGAVMLGVGQSEAAVVESAAPGTPWLDVEGAVANAGWMSPAGIALIAIGAAAAAGGALWLALDGPEEGEVRVALGPGGVRIEGRL